MAAVAASPESRYERISKIGEGTYGVVYLARDIETNKQVALKRMRMEAWTEGVPATALREISVLKEISHPNIVKLLSVFVNHSGSLFLVFELADCDLKQYMDLRRPHGLDVMQAKLFLYQMLVGLTTIHAHRIVHRDMKPQNVLIQGSSIKLADFGLARAFSVPIRVYTHEVVTLWYRAPEILLGAKLYSTPVDLWSVACIFVEMLNGRALFPGDSEIDELYKIFRVLGTPSDASWPGFSTLPEARETFPRWPAMPWSRICPALDAAGVELVSQMLSYDPSRRISAAAALKHPYFADVLASGLLPSGAGGVSPASAPGSSPGATPSTQ